MFDLAIRGNAILTPTGIQKGVVLVHQGLVTDVVPELPPDIRTVVDIGNRLLMPGCIDPHVHINEPGRTDWEGFDTATRAALAGGLTALVDMPLNSSPVTTSADAFDEKIKAAGQHLHTNVGFWGGIIPGNTQEIEPLIEKGVPGFKAFLTHSGIDDFPNATEEDLRKAMPILARHQLPLLVHCELTDIPANEAPWAPTSYKGYLSSRPKSWEDRAITLMIGLCEEYNCPVHIVHLSSANSIEPIRRAKEKGLPLTVETAQHYLYFHAEAIPDAHTEFKCAPPIREKANNEKLWQALKDGIIDFVATDHSPAPPELKQLSSGDFSKAWGGIASLQLAMPILWTIARTHGCTPADLNRWLCEAPARLAGLQGRKGKIAPGYDADLIVWDPAGAFTVTKDMLLHRHKTTPYMNEKLYGVVEQTYLKGVPAYKEGQFQLNKGEIIIR
ncbi:MAG: allantoinase AllB [Bacteroidetes bacterium]|nr:allantoinase AllB [Bacteroidota bacterium]